MSAARWGKTDMVLKLVNEGADIHAQNEVCCLFVQLIQRMRPHYLVTIKCILSVITLQRIEIIVLLSSRGDMTG